jgi:Sigma-70 region 2
VLKFFIIQSLDAFSSTHKPLGCGLVRVGSLDPKPSKPQNQRWPYLNGLTDEQLASCLLAGEQDALAVLFDRYHKLVFSVAMRIVNDPGEAEEVVQVVFLDFFRGLATFDLRRAY